MFTHGAAHSPCRGRRRGVDDGRPHQPETARRRGPLQEPNQARQATLDLPTYPSHTERDRLNAVPAEARGAFL